MKKILFSLTLIIAVSLPSLAGRLVVRHRITRPVIYAPATVVSYGPAIVRASTGRVDVNCNVDEAQVFVNGKLAGLSGEFDGFPGKLVLKPGQYLIKLKYGDQVRRYNLYVSLGHEINLNVDF